MKYSNLSIAGLPKTFVVDYAADYIQPYSDDIGPEDVLYDAYPTLADIVCLSFTLGVGGGCAAVCGLCQCGSCQA